MTSATTILDQKLDEYQDRTFFLAYHRPCIGCAYDERLLFAKDWQWLGWNSWKVSLCWQPFISCPPDELYKAECSRLAKRWGQRYLLCKSSITHLICWTKQTFTSMKLQNLGADDNTELCGRGNHLTNHKLSIQVYQDPFRHFWLLALEVRIYVSRLIWILRAMVLCRHFKTTMPLISRRAKFFAHSACFKI